MNFERYRLLIHQRFGKLQNRYILQDAEKAQEYTQAQEMLFEDQLLAVFQPKSAETEESDRNAQLKQKVETYKVLDGLRQFAKEQVLLIGKPGSGKTTALRKLLLEEVDQQARLTVLIELRSFKTSVLDIAYDFARGHQLGIGREEFQHQLSQGDCLLLLDGLNELPSEAARTDLEAFLNTYSNCRIVATTRDVELGGDFGIQQKLKLQPLTKEQIKRFVRAHLPDEAQATAMLQQLQPRLKDFQETPLLLLMLCAVFQKYKRIPENLGHAFREFARTHDEHFKVGVEKISYCRDLLSYLAFRMTQGSDRLNPLLEVSEEEAIRWLSKVAQVEDSYTWAKDWLTFLRQHHLLQRRRDHRIEFVHQLWQEYYAAEYLLGYLPQLSDEQIKRNFLNLLKCWTVRSFSPLKGDR